MDEQDHLKRCAFELVVETASSNVNDAVEEGGLEDMLGYG